MKRQQLKRDFLEKLNSRNFQITHLFEYVADICFFVKDRKGRFMAGNHSLVEKIRECENNDGIIGLTDADVFPEELAAHYQRCDEAIMTTGEAMINRVEMVPNRDGTVEWHVTTKIPLASEQGEIVGLAGITQSLHKLGDTWKSYHRMGEIIDYITEHYNTHIEVRDMAAISHLSVSQFERVFRQTFGVPPIRLINNFRVHMACAALRKSNKTIVCIALDCGFYDHSHFSREFVRVMGKSPGEYRRSH